MTLFKICAYPGCRRPVPIDGRFCVKHAAAGAALDAKQKEQRESRRRRYKGSAAKRGYGYRWQQLRAAFLREHPLCEECQKKGVIKAATDVDHIKPHRGDLDLMWDRDNLQALCHECHSRKTAREDGGFGNISLP